MSCSFIGERKPASVEKNVLIIGDSHMAGPFGQYLHQSVATVRGVNVITYGHASSAPLHWLSETRHKLSGGVYHMYSANRTINPYELIRLVNPNPTDWRIPVEVPEFESLMSKMQLHFEWLRGGAQFLKPDIVVIELGANDRRAIVQNDQVNQRSYDKRLELTRRLANIATQDGAKCLWIGPPHGRTKTDFEQATLYKMLTEALDGTSCELVSSNHYKAIGCDGVHFNCREEFGNAKSWANEMAQKVKALID
tara:strand:- start:151 stop:906 length:756 start_codon:yes stop_codon:yes gene_type:complete